MCSFSDAADVKAIVQFAPHIIQLGRVDGRKCYRDAVPNSSRVVGNGGKYALSLMYPQTKKSRGERSGDLGSHENSVLSSRPHRPILRCRSCRLR